MKNKKISTIKQKNFNNKRKKLNFKKPKSEEKKIKCIMKYKISTNERKQFGWVKTNSEE